MLNFWDQNGEVKLEHRKDKNAHKLDFDKTPKGIKIPIDLSMMIEKVYISPYSPDYLEENIKLLMDKFGLRKEVVKSDLYTIL